MLFLSIVLKQICFYVLYVLYFYVLIDKNYIIKNIYLYCRGKNDIIQ